MIAGGLQILVLIYRNNYPAKKAEKNIWLNISAVVFVFWFCIAMIFLPIIAISITLANKDETVIEFAWNIASFLNSIFLLLISINPLLGLGKILCISITSKVDHYRGKDKEVE
jgi:hypothetical protein